MTVQLVSKAAYARHRGCDEKAVRKAINEGRISLIDGKIDPAVADIQWARNTRARVSQSAQASQLQLDQDVDQDVATAKTSSAEPGYMAFRSRREEADAQIAEMKAAEMRGTMLMRQDVDRAMFEIGREIRDRLAACSKRIGAEVVAAQTAEACEAIVEREHRIVLEMLVTAFREKVGTAAKVAV